MTPQTFLANALAPSMIADPTARLDFAEITLETARALAADAVSHVGHADTAACFADALRRPVEQSRASLTLSVGDILLIGQIVAGRLPEGATTLPENVRFRWLRITRIA